MKAALNISIALAIVSVASVAAAETTEVITETAAGHVLTKSYDDNDNGTVDRVRTYTYDAAGNELSVVFERFGAKPFAKETTHDYNAGQRIRTAVDNDRDGSVDRITTFIYSDGRLVAEQIDRDADGTIDVTTRFVYDSGKLVAKRIDRGVDGTIDRAVSYRYDAAGSLVSEAIDRDGDGTFDSVKNHATVVASAE